MGGTGSSHLIQESSWHFCLIRSPEVIFGFFGHQCTLIIMNINFNQTTVAVVVSQKLLESEEKLSIKTKDS